MTNTELEFDRFNESIDRSEALLHEMRENLTRDVEIRMQATNRFERLARTSEFTKTWFVLLAQIGFVGLSVWILLNPGRYTPLNDSAFTFWISVFGATLLAATMALYGFVIVKRARFNPGSNYGWSRKMRGSWHDLPWIFSRSAEDERAVETESERMISSIAQELNRLVSHLKQDPHLDYSKPLDLAEAFGRNFSDKELRYEIDRILFGLRDIRNDPNSWAQLKPRAEAIIERLNSIRSIE